LDVKGLLLDVQGYVSDGITLEFGEIIATGTPAWVAAT
jgi:2-keto-4-pentenoate hydratase/2-oxohepta-3-ene-1,7-dioic acid hydratase in catechol pathway